MDPTPKHIDLKIDEVEDGFTIYSKFEEKTKTFIAKSIEEVCEKVTEIYNTIHEDHI